MRLYHSYTSKRGKVYGAGIADNGQAHTRGWDAGVMVVPHSPKNGADWFEVYMTWGSNGAGGKTLIGTVVDGEDGPQFQMADNTAARVLSTENGVTLTMKGHYR